MKNVYTFEKRKSKGFTLIELLAVIMVLGVIMIITIPTVLNSTKRAKKTTFIEYAQKIVAKSEETTVSKLMSAYTDSDELCYSYSIGDDLGYSNTGSFDGWIVYSVEQDKYYITLYNKEYMLINYEFTDETGDLSDIESSDKFSKYRASTINELKAKIKAEAALYESVEDEDDTTTTKATSSTVASAEDEVPEDDAASDITEKTTSKTSSNSTSKYAYAIFNFEKSNADGTSTTVELKSVCVDDTSEEEVPDDGSSDTDVTNDSRVFFLAGKEVNAAMKQLSYAYVNSSSSLDSTKGYSEKDLYIYKIENTSTEPSSSVKLKKVVSSTKTNNQIIMWAEGLTNDEKTAATSAGLTADSLCKIKWYTTSKEIYLPTDISYMFYNLSSVSSIDGFTNSNIDGQILDNPSGTNYVAYLFAEDLNLTGTLSLNFIDTTKVKSFSNVFCDCKLINAINISEWKSPNATTFVSMFNTCSLIKELDLTNLSADSMISAQAMFSYCEALENIIMPNFKVNENALNLANMFQLCAKLDNRINKYLKNFDTSHVTTYNYMFSGMATVKYLNLQNFSMNANRTLVLSHMFENCDNLLMIFTSSNWSKYLDNDDDELNELFWGSPSLLYYHWTWVGCKASESSTEVLDYDSNWLGKTCKSPKVKAYGWATDLLKDGIFGNARIQTAINVLYLGKDDDNQAVENCVLFPMSDWKEYMEEA